MLTELDRRIENMIIMRDMDGRVGNNNKDSQRYMGIYGGSIGYNSGERLIDFV